MKRLLTLAAVMSPLVLTALPTHAVPMNALPAGANAETGLATQVQWRRCGFWRRECAIRWPGLGWRYRRCLTIHGCW
jgi:hypothetical protein